MAMATVPLTIGVDITVLADALNGVAAQMSDIASRLARIEARQARIEQAINANTVNDILNTEALMADFTALHDEVAANGDAVDSAITLLTNLSAQLADAANDPAEIQAIADQLAAQSDALANAVVANTPAAPEPAPVEEPPADEG